jgi:4-hydroxy-3-polyprenylbenzoate decarboxylase
VSGLIVGISGATGAIYGVRTLEALAACGVETHLVVTQSAVRNLLIETNYTVERVKSIASTVYDVDDVGTLYNNIESEASPFSFRSAFFKGPK